MARSQCAACSELFWSGSAFNKHRVGTYGDAIYDDKRRHVIGYTKSERRCLSEQEMLEDGMAQSIQDGKVIWTTGEFDASVFRKKEEHGEV